MMTGKLGLLTAAATVALLIGVVVGTDGLRALDEKPAGEPNPEAGMTDEERLALHAEAHAINARYLADFNARNGDPRSLPVVEVESYAGPSAVTLDEAVRESELIIRGKVVGVTFESAPGGGMPLATSSVEVTASLVGDGPGAVKVFQEGGPVAQGDGGGLVQDDVDPILMPGDSVILLLTYDKKLGAYRTRPGVGVNVIEADGMVRAQEANPFADEINGLKAADFVRKIEAAAR